MLWHSLAAAAIALIAYLANPKKPIAIVVASVVLILLLPFVSSYYFADRDSFVKFEVLVPIILAGIPTLITYFFLDKLIYNKES